jgi:hypothetical protein
MVAAADHTPLPPPTAQRGSAAAKYVPAPGVGPPRFDDDDPQPFDPDLLGDEEERAGPRAFADRRHARATSARPAFAGGRPMRLDLSSSSFAAVFDVPNRPDPASVLARYALRLYVRRALDGGRRAVGRAAHHAAV